METKTNLAYDLSRFETTVKKPKINSKEQIKALPANKKIISPVKAFLLLVIAVTITSSMIFSMVQLTEITDKTAKLEKELAQQQSENVRLNVLLDSKMSLKNIESYAQNDLGLVALEPSQVEYIALTKGNKIEIPENNQANIFEKINSQITKFLEYLAG